MESPLKEPIQVVHTPLTKTFPLEELRTPKELLLEAHQPQLVSKLTLFQLFNFSNNWQMLESRLPLPHHPMRESKLLMIPTKTKESKLLMTPTKTQVSSTTRISLITQVSNITFLNILTSFQPQATQLLTTIKISCRTQDLTTISHNTIWVPLCCQSLKAQFQQRLQPILLCSE